MQTVWPVLIFYLSVLVALGVGGLALATGNSPVLVGLKAGAALLIFSTLGWVLNVVLLSTGIPTNGISRVGHRVSQAAQSRGHDAMSDTPQATNDKR